MSQSLVTQLFQDANQITPYLRGYTDFPQHVESIQVNKDNSVLIQQLYNELAQSSPEGGAAYWLTRTWDLLCWQPVYLCFLSIYRLNALPDIYNMTQFTQPKFVSGFYFHRTEFIHGSQSLLIEQAGQQLTSLFETYRQQMDPWVRIRPGFTRHLLADGLLNCLVKLQSTNPDYSNEQIIAQAVQWLEACNLPKKHLSSLQAKDQNTPLQLIRTSCCLVYKCEGRSLCSDCPRLRRDN